MISVFGGIPSDEDVEVDERGVVSTFGANIGAPAMEGGATVVGGIPR